MSFSFANIVQFRIRWSVQFIFRGEGKPKKRSLDIWGIGARMYLFGAICALVGGIADMKLWRGKIEEVRTRFCARILCLLSVCLSRTWWFLVKGVSWRLVFANPFSFSPSPLGQGRARQEQWFRPRHIFWRGLYRAAQDSQREAIYELCGRFQGDVRCYSFHQHRRGRLVEEAPWEKIERRDCRTLWNRQRFHCFVEQFSERWNVTQMR